MDTGAVVGGAVWIAALTAGFGAAATYVATPAPPATSAATWPVDADVPPPGRPTLLLFAHPRCPCTRATFVELGELLARAPRDVDVHVRFFAPADGARDWEEGDTWRAARAVPRASVALDVDGREAARFGVGASGHVLVYGADGALRFSGGITAGRGHVGDNAGLRAALAALDDDGGRSRATTNVYGCSLRGAK